MILLMAAALALADASPKCPDGDEPAALLCRAVGASDASQFDRAAMLFEQAATASSPSDPRTARMLAAAGNMWIAAGQPGKAALAIDKALAGTALLGDDRALAQLDRARAAEAQGDVKTARRFADQASSSLGKDPYYLYFAAALAVREGDLPRARTAINQAIAAAPDNPEVLFEAGHVAMAEGKSDEARTQWNRAAALDPGGKTGEAAKKAIALLPPAPAR